MRRGPVHHDVEMVVRQLTRRLERLPPNDPEIALVNIAERFESTDRVGQFCSFFDDDVDIHDRLRREARHGCAPNMLDRGANVAERWRDSSPDGFETIRPGRVVRNNPDDLVWPRSLPSRLVAHRSSVPSQWQVSGHLMSEEKARRGYI